MLYIPTLLIGVTAGILSGLFGIGGGIVLVPLLVLVLKFPQHAANGTSLVAMLLPVGMLGAMEYYKAGKIGETHIKYGLLISVGMFFGALLGSKIAVAMPAALLRKIFAVVLALVSVKLWLK